MGETTKWRERQFRAPFERAFVAEEMVSSEKMEGFTWIIAPPIPRKQMMVPWLAFLDASPILVG